MRRFKSIFVLFFGLVVCTALLVQPATGKVTLRVAYNWAGTDPKALVWEARIEEFQAQNPDVTLELTIRGSTAHREGVLTEFAAGSPPDVFLFWADVTNVGPFMRGGVLLDLTNVINSDPELKDRFFSDALANETYNGKIYGMPITRYYCFWFVNKVMFDKYGAPLPSTYDNFLKAIDVFRAQGITPFSTLAKWGDIEIFWSAILLKWAPPGLFQEMVDGTTSFNNPYVIKASDIFQDLVKYLPEGLIGEDYGYPMLQYSSGETPMVYSASWMIGEVEGEVNKTTVAIQFPPIPGGKGDPNLIIGGAAMSLYASVEVARDKAKKEAAIKFMKFMTDPVVYKALVETAGSVPAAQNVPYDSSKVTPIFPSMLDLVKNLNTTNMFSSLIDATSCAEMKNLLDGMVIGKVSSKQFAEGVAKSLEENR